jgi:hypothetical protein
MEWVSQRNLAEWNAEAVLSSLARTVGGNVHIIFGKQIFANKQDCKYFAVLQHSFVRPFAFKERG